MATRHGRWSHRARLRCDGLEPRDTPAAVTVIDYAAGFAAGPWLRGRPAGEPADHLVLTDGPHQARAMWAPASVPVGAFQTSFVFRLTGEPGRLGDGFTFALAGTPPPAAGAAGGGLGYQGLADSVAVKFDLVDNAGEGGHSVGVFTGGAEPTTPAVRLDDTPIHLHAQHPIRADLDYDGSVLTVTLTDTVVPDHTWAHAFPVDIPAAVGGPTAYAGFTAGTGELVARQAVESWTFTTEDTRGPTITGLEAWFAFEQGVQLRATVADDGGSGGLTYTWEMVSAPPGGAVYVYSFPSSPGQAHAYPHVVGPYTFRLTVRDADGRTATRDVVYNHDPRYIAGLELTPESATVPQGGTVQFTAVVRDQYGQPMPFVDPSFQVFAGPGTITRSGLYTAPTDLGGRIAISARVPFGSSRYGQFITRYASVQVESTHPPGPPVDWRDGFAGVELAENGSAQVVGGRLRLTDGPHQAGSAFAPEPVDVRRFVARFEFQVGDTADGRLGDGLALVFQNAGPTALGAAGDGLGHIGIDRSAALRFDLVDNTGDGANSVGLSVNGSTPAGSARHLLPGNLVHLHSGHVFRVDLTYAGGYLQYMVWDRTTGSGAGGSFAVDLPAAVGGPTAYAGFTAGTGELFAPIDVLSWRHAPTDNWSPTPFPA